MAAPEEKKPQEFIKRFGELLDQYPGAGFREVVRLIPDGLFLGVGLFALLSQNYPMAVLFGTLFETLFIIVGMQNLFGYIDLPNLVPTAESASKQCISGFQTPTLETLSFFFKLPIKSSFPSPAVFTLVTAISYVITAMQGFADEISELGPGFSTRYYVGLILSILVLLIVTLFRFLNNCEGAGVLTISLLLGTLLGMALCWQNTTLFGRESTNILGVPLFASRTADGKPLYICPTNQ